MMSEQYQVPADRRKSSEGKAFDPSSFGLWPLGHAIRFEPPTPDRPASASIDKARFGLTRPLSDSFVAKLRRANERPGLPHLGDVHYDREENPLSIEAKQPTRRLIAMMGGASLSALELALDNSFATERKQIAAVKWWHQHLIRPGHTAAQGVCYVIGDEHDDPLIVEDFDPAATIYDSPPDTPHQLVIYPRIHAKLDPSSGPTVRVEIRANDHRTCVRLGFITAADLLPLDLRAFFAEHLIAYTIDPARLGRFMRNRAAGTKRRLPDDNDARTGLAFANQFDTVQGLIDHLGPKHRRIVTALERVPLDHLLPASGRIDGRLF